MDRPGIFTAVQLHREPEPEPVREVAFPQFNMGRLTVPHSRSKCLLLTAYASCRSGVKQYIKRAVRKVH
jgi:hypothetical protein